MSKEQEEQHERLLSLWKNHYRNEFIKLKNMPPLNASTKTMGTPKPRERSSTTTNTVAQAMHSGLSCPSPHAQ
ncbi:hypothetical protein MRX96_051187 [Rhipicephalus microplus]